MEKKNVLEERNPAGQQNPFGFLRVKIVRYQPQQFRHPRRTLKKCFILIPFLMGLECVATAFRESDEPNVIRSRLESIDFLGIVAVHRRRYKVTRLATN